MVQFVYRRMGKKCSWLGRKSVRNQKMFGIFGPDLTYAYHCAIIETSHETLVKSRVSKTCLFLFSKKNKLNFHLKSKISPWNEGIKQKKFIRKIDYEWGPAGFYAAEPTTISVPAGQTLWTTWYKGSCRTQERLSDCFTFCLNLQKISHTAERNLLLE